MVNEIRWISADAGSKKWKSVALSFGYWCVQVECPLFMAGIKARHWLYIPLASNPTYQIVVS